jgi:hypothetical protein
MIMGTLTQVLTKSGRPPGLPDFVRRYGALILGVMLILIFIFVFAPAVSRLEQVEPLITYIEEQDIDATPLFYTESPLSGDAELYIRSSLEYPMASTPVQ